MRTKSTITRKAPSTTCFDANPQTSPEPLTADELREIFDMAQYAPQDTVTDKQQLALERLGAHLDVITPKGDVYLSIAQGRYGDKWRDAKDRVFDHSRGTTWQERLHRRFAFREQRELRTRSFTGR